MYICSQKQKTTDFMNTLTTTRIVYFSPTHTSEKIARAIGEGIGMPRRIETDLTLDEETSPIDIHDELTVLAAPVYGGRVAPAALQRMRRLKGNGSPAILAVVYGNRDYEDALIELRDVAASLGFIPLAGGAFVGEHSFSTPELPIAEGRPDEADLQKARLFGSESLRKWQDVGLAEELHVKGNIPYKTLPPSQPACPTCNENCFVCGECIEVCPTHAIHISDDKERIETEVDRCIKCCACVKACPNRARVFYSPFAAILHEKFSARREPELFF